MNLKERIEELNKIANFVYPDVTVWRAELAIEALEIINDLQEKINKGDRLVECLEEGIKIVEGLQKENQKLKAKLEVAKHTIGCQIIIGLNGDINNDEVSKRDIAKIKIICKELLEKLADV